MAITELPVSPIPKLRVIVLTPEHAPLLQQFFDDNPAYFLATSGAPARSAEALEEITDEPPPGWSFTKTWVLGYQNAAGSLVAMANVVSDLLAPTVWHVGLFIVATARHGTGAAQALYQSLEAWAAANGAAFMRLGVVRGNDRATRFWVSQGYASVRDREGVPMGARTVTVQVMVKPLSNRSLNQYLALVPRDRPEDDALQSTQSVDSPCNPRAVP